jgi:hypothetical protein
MRCLACTLLLILSTVGPAKASNADSTALHAHVQALAGTPGQYRNGKDTATLNKAAAYIYDQMRTFRDSVEIQPYSLQDGKRYANLIASFGPKNAPRIIVGAHYDVCGNQMGADDNASGVAGLLELGRLLREEDTQGWKYRIDLVAYTLEEPPYFRTPAMGSAVHASYLAENKIPVRGMISLEMIGYFKDAKHTQHYPVGLLKLFYGTRGNYITVIHKVHKGSFVRSFQRAFKRPHLVRTKKFGAPRSLAGIDFSDHLNYWDRNWPALMITDTSFFRNANYHESGDTPDTLDYTRLAAVVEQTFRALLSQVQ